MDKTIINTESAPAPFGPYNQAVLVGNLLFISGQIAINPATGNIVATDVIDEAHQVMQNLKSILTEAGLNFSYVVEDNHFSHRI
jgi:2-iminobutanoate/2-iminopropanoate deaminase